MEPSLDVTSIPAWSLRPTVAPIDPHARSVTILGLGDGAPIAARWIEELRAIADDRPREIDHADHALADEEAAADHLRRRLAGATVGWRVMIAGPAAVCARLRAVALAGGLADDEIAIGSTETDHRDIWCVHCDSVTSGSVGIGDVLVCDGCSRRLLVHHHVSRRMGCYLGYQVDAEQLPAESALRAVG